MQHTHDFITLCNDARSRVKELSPEEVDSALKANTIDYIIDVRESDEYQQGHLPQAHHLSKGWIEAKIHHLVKNKDSVIVLYCGGGNRSLLAADNLLKMDYTNLYSMSGGFKGWVGAGKTT